MNEIINENFYSRYFNFAHALVLKISNARLCYLCHVAIYSFEKFLYDLHKPQQHQV